MDTVTFYKDNTKDWRWVQKAPNHEIVGASTEGYKNFQDALDNFERQQAVCYEVETELTAREDLAQEVEVYKARNV